MTPSSQHCSPCEALGHKAIWWWQQCYHDSSEVALQSIDVLGDDRRDSNKVLVNKWGIILVSVQYISFRTASI